MIFYARLDIYEQLNRERSDTGSKDSETSPPQRLPNIGSFGFYILIGRDQHSPAPAGLQQTFLRKPNGVLPKYETLAISPKLNHRS